MERNGVDRDLALAYPKADLVDRLNTSREPNNLARVFITVTM